MTIRVRRLFTWADVDDHMSDVALAGEWPSWLVEASAYWDSLDLRVREMVDVSSVADWLTEQFGPGSVVRDGQEALRMRLESGSSHGSREIVVQIERADSDAVERVPLWRKRSLNARQAEPLLKPTEAISVPLFVFHSYKGGVGRTTHALAAALSLKDRGARTLLIDGDIEAPGLSWMFRDDGREADYAYEDFLALLQGSADGSFDEAVEMAERFVPNQEVDGLLFMPARRDLLSLAPPHVAPADLLVPGRSSYHLSDAIDALARTLKADAVVVDLRAGASELSAQLLLDPRLTRILVTSASAQSLEGTSVVLKELVRSAPAADEEMPFPAVILTQYRDSMTPAALAEIVDPLVKLLEASRGEVKLETTLQPSLGVSIEQGPLPVYSPFRESLLQLPKSWNAVAKVVREAGLPDLVMPIADVSKLGASPAEFPGSSTNAEASSVAGLSGIAESRKLLEDFAQPLTYAESTETQEFLVTDALKQLVTSHRTVLPVAVVSGAKGAGKTFTQLQMVYRGSWRDYAHATQVADVDVDGQIVPVLTSRNLHAAAEQRVNELRDIAADRQVNYSRIEFSDAMSDALSATLSDREWRSFWVWGLARSVGLETSQAEAETSLLQAAEAGARWVFVLDGLEDLLQNIAVDANQQQALRVLLTDGLDWIRSIRSQPFGLVVFVRRDLVRSALPQNSAQFLNRYSNYELLWNEDEAIRLAAWVTVRSGARKGTVDDVQKLDADELTSFMTPVWGEKMGTPRSREARSRAWFLAALSDFNGGIQARDIVLFLAEAAKGSRGDERWSDRLLTPVAMRNALVACSRQKIRAIGEETPAILEIFNRLRDLEAERRQVPFTRDAVGLNLVDIDLLEQNGVVYREENQYWIPEIFRHGLDFRASGRPRVVSVANLVRKRNNSD